MPQVKSQREGKKEGKKEGRGGGVSMMAGRRCSRESHSDRTSPSPVLSLVQLFRRALKALDLLAGLQPDVLQLVPQLVLVLGLVVIPGGETETRRLLQGLNRKH